MKKIQEPQRWASGQGQELCWWEAASRAARAFSWPAIAAKTFEFCVFYKAFCYHRGSSQQQVACGHGWTAVPVPGSPANTSILRGGHFPTPWLSPQAVPSPPALALPAEPPSPMVEAERCSGLAQTSGPRGLLWLAYFGCAGRVASMPPLPPERVLPHPKLAPRHVPQGGAAALAAGAGARSQLEGTSSPGWLPGMAQRPRPAEPPRPRPGPEVSWQAGGQGHRWTPGKIIHRGWSCGQRFRCKCWVPTGSQLKPGHQKPPLSTASSSRTFTLQGFLHRWPVTSAQESKGSIPTMLCNICSCQHCLILMPFAEKHSFKPKAHHLHTPTPTSRAVQGNTHA